MTPDTTPKQRGGARPGSGRKAKGNVRLEINIHPETRAEIFRRAAAAGINPGTLIDRVIR